MIPVTKAEEVVTVLPLVSLMVAVTMPKLPPETMVAGMLFVAILAAAPTVTVDGELPPVNPGLVVVTV